MLFKRLSFFTYLFLGFGMAAPAFSQSRAISDFSEQYQHEVKLFFYPSTLRMVNVADDPDYKEMIKDIKKARWLTYSKEKTGINTVKVRALIAAIKGENYVELMTLDSKDGDIRVYLQEENGKPSGLIGLLEDKKELSAFDVEGFINVKSLSGLINKGFNFENLQNELMKKVDEQVK